jgi:hypothetical protein
MNYTSIENDIVARLAPLVSAGYEVEAMPDNDGSNIPAARKGRITVQVGMVKFLEHKSISSAVVQDEEIYVEIIVRSRKLRATGGVYDLTELCRALLIGYTPTNCKVMLRGVDWGGITPSERFDGIWTYSLRLATQSVSVGSADEDISVLISQITLLDGFSIDAPTPTIEIYASAYNVDNSGDQVIIAWVSTNADEVTISGLGVVAANGTATITMSVNTTFTATASNAYGDDSSLINVTVGATCEDAIIELNGVQVATVASGATEDFPILNGGGNAIGTWDGTSFVVANNYTEINGVQVTDQEAEVNASIAVELDGNPSGTWNAGTQTWEVTSDPCLDATVENSDATFTQDIISGDTYVLDNYEFEFQDPDGVVISTEIVPAMSASTFNFPTGFGADAILQRNAIQIKSIPSAATFNLKTKLDGVANNGTWDGVDTLDFTSSCSPVALQINGTPQESIAAGATFNLIATLDGVAGGTYTPATDTLAFTSTGGYVRPADWRTLPTLTAASEAGYVLLLVYENRLNRFTLQIPNGTVDWGDGTTSAASGAVRTKTYTYSTIAQTVFVDPITGENYKQVIIGITRLGAAITTVDFTASAATSPLNAPSYAVDYNLSFPNCTDFRVSAVGLRDARFAKILKIWALGTLGGVCRIGNTNNLRILQLPTTFSGALGGFGSLARGMGNVPVGNVNFGTATNCHFSFYVSNIVSHGNLIANSATTLENYASENPNIETFGTVTANTCTSIELSWYNCLALTSIGLLTLPVCTNYFGAFYNTQLTAIRFADSTACTNTTSMIGICPALQLLHCPNLTRGVNFTGTSIGNYGMNIFASGDGILNGIGTASGAQTITITGTPFGALVTASDATALAIRLVLTTKGYTIAN